jgi:hypothetical protein
MLSLSQVSPSTCQRAPSELSFLLRPSASHSGRATSAWIRSLWVGGMIEAAVGLSGGSGGAFSDRRSRDEIISSCTRVWSSSPACKMSPTENNPD